MQKNLHVVHEISQHDSKERVKYTLTHLLGTWHICQVDIESGHSLSVQGDLFSETLSEIFTWRFVMQGW